MQLLGGQWYAGRLVSMAGRWWSRGWRWSAWSVWLLTALLRGGLGLRRATVDDALAALWPTWCGISPRRRLALARLAVKEAIRRRVVVVFVRVPGPLALCRLVSRPAQHQSGRGCTWTSCSTTTSYLMLLLALFLSALSLPADIKNRTLHTVVTKPVRASEIVLGRIVGFTAVGTRAAGG